MNVEILDHVAGARAARGTAVIVDVFRAFSVAPHAFARGAARVVPVAETELALELKRRHPEYVILGERHARRLPGFDGGNSPAEIEAMDLAGRTVVHTTHAGTQGLVNATGAGEVLTGAFVNLSAVARHLLRTRPVQVSIVRMGHEARERCEEDDLYAEYLAALLQGRRPEFAAVRERLRTAPAAVKFFDPEATWAPERDFELCTEVDRFDFVLRLRRDPGALPELERLVPAAPSDA